jgi:hypothetical protein
MSIKHYAKGHLFAVPYDLPAYQDNADGDSWDETQMLWFATTPAGQWLEDNRVPYEFFIKVLVKEHGDPFVFIKDDQHAMLFKMANVGV